MRCPRCGRPASDHVRECEACGFGFEPAAPQPLTPEQEQLDLAVRTELGAGFGVERVLRRGADGAQYLARDGDGVLRWTLSVVMLPDTADLATTEALQVQLQRAAALDHPHVARQLGHGVSDTLVWCLTESVEGWTLQEVLAQGAHMPPDHALRLISQVGSALDYAHRRGVVHGSLNPSNVVIDRHGWVRVTHFAMRLALAPNAASSGQWSLLGMVPFLAPEQHSVRPGATGGGVDQYALAVLVHQCLTGDLPRWKRGGLGGRQRGGNTSLELMSIHERCPGVAKHIDGVVSRALRGNPLERFATVLEFVGALDGCAAVEASDAPRAQAELRDWNLKVLLPDPPPAPAPMPRKRIAIIAAPAVLLLMGTLFLARRAEAPAEAQPGVPGVMLPPQPARRQPPQAEVTERPSSLPIVTPEMRPVSPPPRRETAAPARPPAAPPASSGTTDRTNTAAPPARTAAPPPRQPAPAPAAQLPGSLSINSRPWGEVFLDTQHLGHTPLVGVLVAPGVYRLRIVRDGFEPHERMVQVLPGQQLRLTQIALKEIVP